MMETEEIVFVISPRHKNIFYHKNIYNESVFEHINTDEVQINK